MMAGRRSRAGSWRRFFRSKREGDATQPPPPPAKRFVIAALTHYCKTGWITAWRGCVACAFEPVQMMIGSARDATRAAAGAILGERGRSVGRLVADEACA